MPPLQIPPYICRNCLQGRIRTLPLNRPDHHGRRRLHSIIHSPLPPNTPAFAQLPTRRLISLSGPDAAHFLQGLTTINIPPSSHTRNSQATRGDGFYSAFLNASGRVLHDVFIYPTSQSQVWMRTQNGQGREEEGGGFLIEVDANEAEGLAKHLARFKLRAKVAIRVVDEADWGVYASWDQGKEDNDARLAPSSAFLPEGVIGCVDGRAPNMGNRYVLPKTAAAAGTSELGKLAGAEEVESSSYNIRRITMGVAEGQDEIWKETALPQESNIDFMGGIDFRKGCYVGQELTIRTHHTGVVRKRILPVQIYGSDHDDDDEKAPPEKLDYNPNSKLTLPLRGANISRVDKKGRSAGKWIGGVGNIGLALCRLEVMTGTVTGEGTHQWKPDDEFNVAMEAGVGEEGREARRPLKIKAFVPAWHAERAEKLRL